MHTYNDQPSIRYEIMSVKQNLEGYCSALRHPYMANAISVSINVNRLFHRGGAPLRGADPDPTPSSPLLHPKRPPPRKQQLYFATKISLC